MPTHMRAHLQLHTHTQTLTRTGTGGRCAAAVHLVLEPDGSRNAGRAHRQHGCVSGAVRGCVCVHCVCTHPYCVLGCVCLLLIDNMDA